MYSTATGGVEEGKLDLRLNQYVQSTFRSLNMRHNASTKQYL